MTGLCSFARRHRTVLAITANVFLFLLGCGPNNLGWMMLGFTDEKAPPEGIRLGDPKKERTVAIVCSFIHSEEDGPEVLPADNELADKLQQELRKRCKDNKEKIKFVPNAQVRTYLSKHRGKNEQLPDEIGAALKADMVVVLDITRMSLYEPRSGRHFFRGNTHILISVYDMSQKEGERRAWDKDYTCEYPRTRGPIEADGADVSGFRNLFIKHIAEDFARLFTSYDPDEAHQLD